MEDRFYDIPWGYTSSQRPQGMQNSWHQVWHPNGHLQTRYSEPEPQADSTHTVTLAHTLSDTAAVAAARALLRTVLELDMNIKIVWRNKVVQELSLTRISTRGKQSLVYGKNPENKSECFVLQADEISLARVLHQRSRHGVIASLKLLDGDSNMIVQFSENCPVHQAPSPKWQKMINTIMQTTS